MGPGWDQRGTDTAAEPVDAHLDNHARGKPGAKGRGMNHKFARRGPRTDERGSTRFSQARMIVAAGACLAIGAAFGPSLATAAIDSAKDVIVRNTDAEPVPTRAIGTTQVDASGSTVTVQGSPSAPAVPVQVTNQPPAAPAEEHVQTFTEMTIPGGETHHRQVLLEVPAGKRFVARQLSGEVLTVQDGAIRAQVSAHNFNPNRSFTIALPLTPGLGNDAESLNRGIFNEEMHFEVRGPGEVTGAVVRLGPKPDSTTGSGWVLVGTLLDCASCQPAS